ncbi:MAG TPA: class I SAM-dependent methyltransferase [Bryobacteraceae bacterium]|nr:class I SAM-dependent methyltransferase [Bryobacteraceae bacterium]
MAYHTTRFPFDARREILWKTLCEAFFQRLIPPDACVLELGAGYCHFINNIQCQQRIAVDIWPGVEEHARPPVIARAASITELDFIDDGSVDFVFASNLFEHLQQAELARALAQVRRKLRPGGSLNIVQPNYRYAYREYFDDYTHVAIYSHVSLTDFLEANGFRVTTCVPRFLPLTIKSRFPVSPLLIKLYLQLPVKPLGKQMFLRAVTE